MVSPQGSILAGVVSPRADYVGALAGGMQIAQDRQAHQQNMAMNQQAISQQDYTMATQRLGVINRIAQRVRSLAPQDREAFVQSLNPQMLESVGIDPAQVAGVDLSDRGLDAIIAQTGAAMADVDTQQNIQQATYVPGLGYVQQRRDGSVVLQELNEDQKGRVRGAMDAESDRRAREAAGKAGAVLDVRTEKEPTLTDLNTRSKDSASQAVKQIGEYSNQLSNINANIKNYDEGIRLVDEGANTGVIASRLPSIRANAIKLNNLRNRLGLDVVSSVTFGALSEAELNMALDTGMPDKLSPPELRQWFVERRDAQQKLANSIDSAIQFLNVPGNTLADLHALQRQDSRQQGGSGRGAMTPGIAPPAATGGEPSIDDLLRMY